MTAKSETVNEWLSTLIDIKGTNMIISDHDLNKFTIRNRSNLSVIKTIHHRFGHLWYGFYHPGQKIVTLGISDNLVEFDFEKMKFTKKTKTLSSVFHIEKVNDESFLVGEYNGYLELINKKDLTCLSILLLEGV